MDSSPESTPAKRQETKSLSRQTKSRISPWAQPERGGCARLGFTGITIRMNYCSRKRLRLYTLYPARRWENTTYTHLFAPCDKLFVVRFGELRMQRHDLGNNKQDENVGCQAPRQAKTGFIKTYFDGTVKDLVEALSRIETQHLNLQHRRDIKRKAMVNCSETSALIAAFVWPAGGNCEKRGAKNNSLSGALLLC